MILTWLAQSRPYYVSQNGTFPFISDIGADILKPWFIIGCTFTAITFFFTLFSERWLRHRGRLQQNSHRNQKILAICAIVASAFGGLSLILLAVFDTKGYENLHRLFLGIFMIGVFFSAVFTVVQYAFMVKLSPEEERAHLRTSSIVKSIVATALIGAGVGMAVCLGTGRYDAGAYLEWIIAFGFTLYPLTFFIDLREVQPRVASKTPQASSNISDDHDNMQEIGAVNS
ncbi:hypothetical protein FRC03_003091 [Tulasnella sp. 419]|nr:hypothetical protein FRC02_000714 [Tulasnella sp. 418]KAG8969400.1 hypothetical protein FRC03_003091 [Tulasnella sp. 419]